MLSTNNRLQYQCQNWGTQFDTVQVQAGIWWQHRARPWHSDTANSLTHSLASHNTNNCFQFWSRPENTLNYRITEYLPVTLQGWHQLLRYIFTLLQCVWKKVDNTEIQWLLEYFKQINKYQDWEQWSRTSNRINKGSIINNKLMAFFCNKYFMVQIKISDLASTNGCAYLSNISGDVCVRDWCLESGLMWLRSWAELG